MAWYFTRNGQRFGPYTEEELRALVAKGQLTSGDLVWREGMPGWAPAHEALAGIPPPSPPPPPPPPMQTVAVPQTVPAAPAKSRVAYVLLGVFLGTLGIHNFYAGYTGRAIAQLVITVVFGWWLVFPAIAVAIWAFIEVVVVTKDASGNSFV